MKRTSMKKGFSSCLLMITVCISTPGWGTQLLNKIDLTGEITNLHNGKQLTSRELLIILSKQQRIIIGEHHDNAAHHLIEHWLIEELPKHRPQGSLLLEMINPDQQANVNRVKKSPAVFASTSSEMMQALSWQKGWNWAFYGSIVRTAIAAPYPLLSANLNRDEVLGFYQHPVFTSGKFSSRPDVRQSLSKIIRLSHGNKIEQQQLNAMLAIQQQRDKRMAQSLLAAPTPSLLIAGGYHAAKNLGVPLHMLDVHQGEQPVVLMLVEKGTATDSRAADYQWATMPAHK